MLCSGLVVVEQDLRLPEQDSHCRTGSSRIAFATQYVARHISHSRRRSRLTSVFRVSSRQSRWLLRRMTAIVHDRCDQRKISIRSEHWFPVSASVKHLQVCHAQVIIFSSPREGFIELKAHVHIPDWVENRKQPYFGMTRIFLLAKRSNYIIVCLKFKK